VINLGEIDMEKHRIIYTKRKLTNKINCSKCAYESMILQEFISATKQFLEEKNEEYSDKLLGEIIQQTNVMVRECGVKEDNFYDLEPFLTKVRTYIDKQEFDKAINGVGNAELHIRNVLKG